MLVDFLSKQFLYRTYFFKFTNSNFTIYDVKQYDSISFCFIDINDIYVFV